MRRSLFIVSVAALAVAASADAGVITTSSASAFDLIASSRGYQRADFLSFAVEPGAYAQLNGGTAWNAWSMAASEGMLRAMASGDVRSEDANRTITISFASGSVFAVGGNFFCGDAAGAAIPGSQVRIALASGQSYVANSSITSFAGFISTEAITSITIQRQVAGPDAQYASVGSLVVAGVPAPGSIALLAAAGLAGPTRRRR